MNPVASKRVPELDGLRGLAIALVLWHHLVERYLPVGPATWLGWLHAGTVLSWTGVDLFFVLSGYFIGGILIDHRDSPQLARTFYLRRAVRILPLYYVTLAVSLTLVAVRWPGASQDFPGWVYGLFLTNIAFACQNSWDWFPLSVLWSIAVEEQFYLAAPWVARWIPTSRLPFFLVALIGLAWGLRAIVYYFHPKEFLSIHALMPMRMDTLALGVLLAWAVRTPASASFFGRLRRTWGWWLAAAGLLLFLANANRYLHVEAVDVYISYTVIAVSYALLVAIVAVVQPPRLVRVLASWLPTRIGRYSYFIYLWHMLIGWGIVSWLGGPDFELNSLPKFGIVLVAVGATLLAGMASWKYFESPFLKLGQRSSYE